MKFKVGDKVLCIDNIHREEQLSKDVVYTITKIDKNTIEQFVYINKKPQILLASRFISATKYLAQKVFNKKFEDFLKPDVKRKKK